MWECPKCGRKFKNTNQSHYCGTAPQSIEEYIAQQPEDTQLYLRQINEAIHSALPGAVQKISWSMPTYWKKAEPDPVCGIQKAHWAVSRSFGGRSLCRPAARIQNQ